MSFTVWRDIWIAAAAQVVSGTGAFLVMTTLILDFQDTGRGGLAVAALAVASAIPTVVLAPLTGRMADRFDSRTLLVVAGAIQVVSALLLSIPSGVVAQTGLLALLYVGTAIAQPVRSALLPAMASREDLPRASAIGQTASSMGVIIGPALAGFSLDALGAATTLRFASAAYLATIAAGLALRTRRGGKVSESSRGGAGESVPARMDDLLRMTMIGIGVVIGAVSAANVVDVFFIRETLGGSATVYGIVSSMWTVGLLGGAWVMARLSRYSKDDGSMVIWTFGTLGGISIAIAGASVAHQPLWIVPAWLIGGLLNGGGNVLVSTLLGRRAAPAARGRIAARLQATIQGMGLAGFIAGGLLVEFAEPRATLLGAGLAGALAVIVVLPWVRRAVLRSRSAGPVPPARALASVG